MVQNVTEPHGSCPRGQVGQPVSKGGVDVKRSVPNQNGRASRRDLLRHGSGVEHGGRIQRLPSTGDPLSGEDRCLPASDSSDNRFITAVARPGDQVGQLLLDQWHSPPHCPVVSADVQREIPQRCVARARRAVEPIEPRVGDAGLILRRPRRAHLDRSQGTRGQGPDRGSKAGTGPPASLTGGSPTWGSTASLEPCATPGRDLNRRNEPSDQRPTFPCDALPAEWSEV